MSSVTLTTKLYKENMLSVRSMMKNAMRLRASASHLQFQNRYNTMSVSRQNFSRFPRSRNSSSYLQNKHIERLEREANGNPHNAAAQVQYLQALNKIRPAEVIKRVESGLFATNKQTAREYVAALSNTSGVQSSLTSSIGGGSMTEPISVRLAQPPFKEQFFSIFQKMLGVCIVIAGASYFLEREKSSGGSLGRAMGMGVSKERKPVMHCDKTFADVKGAEEAKNDLREIIEFLRNPERFQRLGGKLPKGVLLTGPPGTGKTLLAKCVAGEAKVPFFYASGSEFEEMFVGVGARRIRDLFKAARAHSPCIVFIDEIDAIGGKRSMKDQSALKMTLNEMLQQLDGFESDGSNVIVVAATNFPDSLDPALVRPGRFDRNVVVPLPSLKDREEILKLYLQNIPTDPDLDVSVLARGTPGCSGAELSNMINAAAIQASVDGKEFLSQADIEYAKDKILMGAERKSYVMRPQEIWNTACHEGGHALVALLTPGADPIHKATIIPRGRSLGHVLQLPENDVVSLTRKQIRCKLDVMFGGRVAEELMFGKDNVTTGATNDMQQATNLARRCVMQFGFSDSEDQGVMGLMYEDDVRRLGPETRERIDKEVKEMLQGAYNRTMRLMRNNKPKLLTLANALKEYETLTGSELEDLIQGKKLEGKLNRADKEAKRKEKMRIEAEKEREASKTRQEKQKKHVRGVRISGDDEKSIQVSSTRGRFRASASSSSSSPSSHGSQQQERK